MPREQVAPCTGRKNGLTFDCPTQPCGGIFLSHERQEIKVVTGGRRLRFEQCGIHIHVPQAQLFVSSQIDVMIGVSLLLTPLMPKVVSRSAVSSSTDGKFPPAYLMGLWSHLRHIAQPTASSAAALRLYCELKLSDRTKCAHSTHQDCICGEFIVRFMSY